MTDNNSHAATTRAAHDYWFALLDLLQSGDRRGFRDATRDLPPNVATIIIRTGAQLLAASLPPGARLTVPETDEQPEVAQ